MKHNFLNMQDLTPVFLPEEILEIENLLSKKHMQHLENECFKVQVCENNLQIQVVMTLLKKDKTESYPIESLYVKDPSSKNRLNSKDCALLIVDYLDIYFNEFFTEDRNVFLPLNWSSHTFENESFFLRGFVRKLDLETQADFLLAKKGHGDLSIHSISSDY